MDLRSSALLKERIAAWLAVTRDVEVRVGLDGEKARVRAEVLLDSIRKGSVKPEETPVDEELKQVLSVTVVLLADSAEVGESRLKLADAVYKFIEQLEWPEDPLGEKPDLLLECAEIGFGAVGLSIADVNRRRAPTDTAGIHDSRIDPVFSLSAGEVEVVARRFFEAAIENEAAEIDEAYLRDGDVVLAICALLRENREVFAKSVAKQGERLYRKIAESRDPIGLFDEREYLLGELALQAGIAFRFLGKLEEADRWLDRAEANFRHTVNPAPQLADAAYARLALKHTQGRHDDVLELVPSLIGSFEKLGMANGAAKSRFLEALSLKAMGRASEALEAFEMLSATPSVEADPPLLGQILLNVGSSYTSLSEFAKAAIAYERAIPVIQQSNRPAHVAELKWALADAYRGQGRFEDAIAFYRGAQADYKELGMRMYLAMLHLTVADVLLTVDRGREAEWEILAALPTIEEQKMVPEGFAAAALLKESVRRRKTDPNALRELREHIQASNQK
jgi:tetratricopeptide (TPR) repeat protein